MQPAGQSAADGARLAVQAVAARLGLELHVAAAALDRAVCVPHPKAQRRQVREVVEGRSLGGLSALGQRAVEQLESQRAV